MSNFIPSSDDDLFEDVDTSSQDSHQLSAGNLQHFALVNSISSGLKIFDIQKFLFAANPDLEASILNSIDQDILVNNALFARTYLHLGVLIFFIKNHSDMEEIFNELSSVLKDIDNEEKVEEILHSSDSLNGYVFALRNLLLNNETITSEIFKILSVIVESGTYVARLYEPFVDLYTHFILAHIEQMDEVDRVTIFGTSYPSDPVSLYKEMFAFLEKHLSMSAKVFPYV